MPESLRELSATVSSCFSKRAQKHFRASFFAKAVLVAVFSAVIGLAQFAHAPEGQGYTFWQMAGMASSIIVFVGSIFILLLEHDASTELNAAHQALEAARELRSECDEALSYVQACLDDSQQSIQLYAAMSSMRAVIEQSITLPTREMHMLIDTIMAAAKYPLPIAMGVEQDNQWTICVFQAIENDDHRVVLKPVAHHRALECDISQARSWPEGVGAAGQAYAMSSDVIIPDMQDVALGTIYQMDDTLKRAYDEQRYKSLAAVPILVNSDKRPWGVVVGTNDVANHFADEHDPPNRAVEALRALAGMVALGVSVSRLPDSQTGQPAAQELQGS